MKDAFFLGLLIFLQISIYVNIKFIIAYATRREKGSMKGLLMTGFAIFLIGLLSLIILMNTSDVVKKFKMEKMMVLESGLLFFFLLYVKGGIALRTIRRAKSPEFYDISFFGKKVYRPNVVKKSELAIFLLTMPFTLICGAYFIANVFFSR